MNNSLYLLIPLSPWLAALWLGACCYLFGWNRGESGERHSAMVAIGATLLSLLLLLWLDGNWWWNGSAPGAVRLGSWLDSGRYQVALDLALDQTGLPLATLASVLSLITLRFSVNYLHREASFQRFFIILLLFIGALLLLLLAGNAVLAFVGWELMGLSSYLLIGYSFDRSTATSHAAQALITNRFGDVGFIAALLLSLLWCHSTRWSDLSLALSHTDNLRVTVLVTGFIVAALAKSALFPFSSWIGRALEGPTPSSALFYGSLMVHAGIFLLLRLAPLLQQMTWVMPVLALLALLSIGYSFYSGLVQNDIKSILMASTQTQIGLMLLEYSLGWFDWLPWHIGLHAIWRCWQFLMAPSELHLLPDPSFPEQKRIVLPSWLYPTALQRFWLDALANLLLVQPTRMLARDMARLEQRISHHLYGTTLINPANPGDSAVSQLLWRLADWCNSVEQRLLLHNSSLGMERLWSYVTRHLLLLDHLLAQPRYLVLLIVITFMIIL
ncbi:MAG: hypothetical protein HQL58_10635 [Magnetococcales bacterium]|nr:hypothetical protein [Magnetococcales bacterium]